MKQTLNFLPILFSLISLLFIGGCSIDDDRIPILTTDSPLLGYNYADITGSEYLYECTEVGICWNTTGNPTRNNYKVVCNHSSSWFIGRLTNLSRHTTYYARAYGVRGNKTYYGNEVSFKLEPQL